MDILSYVLAKSYADKRIEEAERLGFNVVIVDELPPIGQKNTIYLIGNSKGEYEEWLYVDNAWRKIGSQIDLSGYVKTEELQAVTTRLDGRIDNLSDLIRDDYVKADQVASDSVLGLVKSSTALNKIQVEEDGTMSIGSVGVNKLENVDGFELVLDSNE